MNVYTLGYPFLASFQELLVEQLTNQQLLSSEVGAKKDETKKKDLIQINFQENNSSS